MNPPEFFETRKQSLEFYTCLPGNLSEYLSEVCKASCLQKDSSGGWIILDFHPFYENCYKPRRKIHFGVNSLDYIQLQLHCRVECSFKKEISQKKT